MNSSNKEKVNAGKISPTREPEQFNDLASREAAINRRLRNSILGVPWVFIIAFIVACWFGIFSLISTVVIISILLGLFTVSAVATLTGFLELFRLRQAAFVIIVDPPLSAPCPIRDRKVLLGRQPDDGQPHPGQLIYPGGLFNPRRDDDLRETALYKAKSMTGCEVNLASQPLATYERRLPFPEIAYVGVIFEGWVAKKRNNTISNPLYG